LIDPNFNAVPKPNTDLIQYNMTVSYCNFKATDGWSCGKKRVTKNPR